MQPFRVRKVRPWCVVGFLLAGLLVQSGMAQVTKETADVVGQGSAGPVVSVGGANLWRSDTGVSVSLRMPTPVPGTYIYPPPSAFQPVVSEGHPEVDSFWIFAFNEPAECLSHPCDVKPRNLHVCVVHFSTESRYSAGNGKAPDFRSHIVTREIGRL